MWFTELAEAHFSKLEPQGEEFWAGLAVGEALSEPVNYGRRL